MIPVRLRPATQKSIGTTAFFRNRVLLDSVCQLLGTLEQQQIKVLFHACSIGAEVYSFLIAASLHPALANKTISVSACDHEADFLNFGKNGIYPIEILNSMHPNEKSFFEPIDSRSVRVKESIRSKVTFLPACSFQDFESTEKMDVVFLLNALLYLPIELQAQALDKISQYNSHILITTGFHFNSIKNDMQRNGYLPYLENAKAIHDGWLDRRKAHVDPNEVIPGLIFHPWGLPPYETITDYEYIYTAIFKK